jgi:hypothetical protein
MLRTSLVFAAAFLLGGCTLVASSTRPVPGAERNLRCQLEYRPDPQHDGPDLLFTAGGSPYKLEEAYMSLPDMLVHLVFAPGRHLAAPAVVRGARCQTPLWEAGHRVPLHPSIGHYLACTREGVEAVELAVATKWGTCRRTIPAGDDAPRCFGWVGEPRGGLRLLSQEVCVRAAPLSARRP